MKLLVGFFVAICAACCTYQAVRGENEGTAEGCHLCIVISQL